MTQLHVLSVILPHRIAGGIGLALLGVGLMSGAFFPIGRNMVARNATLFPTKNGGKTVPDKNRNISVAEPETMERSFVVCTEPLPEYRVRNLAESLPKTDRVELIALTQNGRVLATVSPPPPKALRDGRPSRQPAPRTQAARFIDNKWQRLPIPAGVHRVAGSDMNENGDVVAVSIRYRRGKPSYNRVLLYSNSTAPYQDIGTIDPDFADTDRGNPNHMRGVSESAVSLNNAGMIVALVGGKSWYRHPSGTIGHLGDGAAYDLNNGNSAVGFSASGGGNAVIWRNISPTETVAPFPLLPTQKGEDGKVRAILHGTAECVNDIGDAIVSVQTDSPTGFRRQGKTVYYFVHGKKMQQIAQMRGFQNTRTHINRNGDVVGFSDSDQITGTVAPFLYRQGKMYDLTFAAQRSGYRIVAAVDINDRGQILAYGVSTAPHRDGIVPVLLSPP